MLKEQYPKITIITPTYGQGQYIGQTIESVLDQNYPNLEYMILDGGSRDNTVDVIKKYEKYLSYWVSEPDKGQSDAINKGLQRATGEIINWLNSDDYYEPNCLHTVAEHFSDDDTHIVCGRSNLFEEEGKVIRISPGTDIYPNNLAKTIGWARIDQPETFFKKKALDKMGLVDASYHFVMDKEWWIRYLIHFGLDNIKKIDQELVNFRWHDASKTISQQDSFMIETSSLYYNIAKSTGQEKIMNVIRATGKLNEKLALNIEKHTLNEHQEVLKEAMHYYMLYCADYYYSVDQRTKAKQYLSVIDASALQEEDQKLLKKIKFRSQFLPVWLKNRLK